MKKTTFYSISALLFGVGVVGSAQLTDILYNPTPDGPRSQAVWKFVAEDLQELVDYSDVIILGEALTSTTNRVVPSDDGSDRLPFELTEFKVLMEVKGMSSDAPIFVERAGGVDPSTNLRKDIDLDGGHYAEGEVNLLFLKQQPDTSYYYVVNDQGRYPVENGFLEALDDHGPVMDELNGLGVDTALRIVMSLVH